MRTNILVTAILAAIIPAAPSAQQPAVNPMPPSTRAGTGYGKLPLTFEINRGQASSDVKFLSRGNGYTAFLTAGGMVLSLRPNPPVRVQPTSSVAGANQSPQTVNTTLRFKLVGAAPNPAAVGENPQPGLVNYFIGGDPAKWHTNVSTYASVRYKNVYPGIDLVYYGNHRQLEYDFVISPKADPGRIQFEITGATQIALDANGKLVLKTVSGEIDFQSPGVYQESNGQRLPLHGSYVLKDPTHVAFQLGEYDPSKLLVIDPVLVYGTYLGGGGSDQASGIAVDGSGSVYVAGYTDSADFLLTTFGAPSTNADHVFVAKFDSTGSNLVYADYIGGNGEDYGIGLALDSANNVYVTGSTTSSDFPTATPYQAVEPGPYSGFVTKISASGTSLLYSTYLGGNGFDEPAGIAVDNLGEAYVAGTTTSQNFPVLNANQSAALASQGGLYGNYGFVTKFAADGSSLVYSTYLEGNTTVVQNCGTPCWPAPYTAVSTVALDANGNAYVAGATNTSNFPATSGAYLTSNSTQQDASVGFVTKFASAGSLDYSTYFYGSSGNPVGIGAITVDGSGSAYIAGTVISDGTFPITTTAICDPSVYGYGCSYAFVTKFDPTASTLLYSTFLGPNNYASPRSIAVDPSDNAYVVANTESAVFGTSNALEGYSNGEDMLLVEIDASATTELFATYLGGSSSDSASGIALDANGNIYVVGSTDSVDFPVTQGAYQNVLGGGTDAFVVKIGASSAPAVAVSPGLLQYAARAVGSTSPAQTVLLRNMGSSVLSISSITTSGDFTQTDTCEASVAAAASCTFSVTFTPTTAGLRSGSILIQDDAAGSPHVIYLSGTGSGAVATLTPASLTFPLQQPGTSSAAQAVTLTNSGNATLNVGTIQAAGDFTQVNNCPAALAANSSCAINVTFTPTAAGPRNGTLTITDSGTSSPQTVSLTGTGSGAVATLTPASLTFPSQPLGTSSAAQAVTLTNSGNATLNVGTIQAAGDFTEVNNCPATVAANSSCAIDVTFTPTAAGSRNGTLTINDSGTGSPQTVNLTGTGSAMPAAIATITPASLVFPSQQLRTSSAAQAVTLTNSGNATLNVGNILIAGDYAQTNTCPPTLAPNSSCKVNITFTPTTSGTRNGTLTVNDNVQGSPQVANLAGVGSDFGLTSSPSSYTLKAGATATYQLAVSPVSGTYSGTVKLTCSGAPALATCTISPNAVTPNASAASATLTITTTASVAQAVPLHPSQSHPIYVAWISLQGLGLCGIVLAGSRSRSRKPRAVILFILMMAAMIIMFGCAGGTGFTTPPQSGTTPGTYAITVTGTSTSLQHSLPLTLTVN